MLSRFAILGLLIGVFDHVEIAGSEPTVAIEQVEGEPAITDVDRSHWAFQPVRSVQPPKAEDQGWCRTAVDRFIVSRLESQTLQPLPEADRTMLLRRVTFDLTGLPPAPEMVDAFLADDSPDAYERIVDQLLASPAYGERQALYWLDLARFAETDGFEHDKLRPEAWRYRDWVITAFNADLPYDQFVASQLAADELTPDDPDTQLATGFLLAGPDMPDINLQEERRHTLLNAMTANVGEVLLGLQFGCCECHDHKSDPLSQRDFYRLRACFDAIDLFGEQRLDPNSSDEPQTIGQKSRVVRTALGATPPSRLWVRGDFRRPGPELAPAVPRVAMSREGFAIAPDSLRRSQLAAWITSPENPLTARVIVNRLWQQHFGVGLVASPSDFGLMGSEPSHPELLDWLATELLRNDWSLKALQRVLVTSAVYRTASRPNNAQDGSSDSAWDRLVAADPENRWLGRARRRRLEGEAIRDALLAVSGQLNDEAGGPGIRPPLPPEVVKTLLKDQWPVTGDLGQHARRSIYLFVRRNLKYPLFEAFDRPDQNLSCSRRMQTTIAPQALVMLNSELTHASARRLARQLASADSANTDKELTAAYRTILARSPTVEELAAAREFIAADPLGWPDLVLGLLNTSEFVYVD